MLRILSAFIFIALITLQACKTDIDINAPAKETMVIFGLIDPSEDYQYIKINKTFLGDANNSAYALALNSKNTNYEKGDLTVIVERYENEVLKQTYTLRDTTLTKDVGLFATDNNTVYYFKTSPRLSTAKNMRQSTFKLIVTNKKTGLKAVATTPLVYNAANSIDTNMVTTSTPNGIDNILYFPGTKIQFVLENGGYNAGIPVAWQSSKNGRLYQLTVRFHYNEFKNPDRSDLVAKYVDWDFGQIRSKQINGGEAIEQTPLVGSAFYNVIKQYVKPSLGVTREIGQLEFRISAAEENLATYIDVNKPSTGFAIDKPSYTNVKLTRDGKQEDGLGIFSCRGVTIKFADMGNKTKDTLVRGHRTIDLGFKK